jgi:hypothetical protein
MTAKRSPTTDLRAFAEYISLHKELHNKPASQDESYGSEATS